MNLGLDRHGAVLTRHAAQERNDLAVAPKLVVEELARRCGLGHKCHCSAGRAGAGVLCRLGDENLVGVTTEAVHDATRSTDDEDGR